MAKVCPLFSGSSGNASFIGNSESGILVDAGVSCKQIVTALDAIGNGIDTIKGIFITHEHIDHVRGLRVLLKKYSIPVYASQGTLSYLADNDMLPENAVVNPISGAVEAGGMEITPFATSHDAAQSCGYSIKTADNRKICVSTDLGVVTAEVEQALLGSDLVILEANYEKRMLECGPYPYYLKRRIMGERGHLSNDNSAELALKLAENGTTRFFLAHLSRENNAPNVAYTAVTSALHGGGLCEGKDYLLTVAERCAPSKPMYL